ncbi:ABC transporter substrate-binding protein [Herpetosiphon geysericola]|uniref:Thiamine pyrimidine synthase n=1 Tax=Herpetosiphon geysericola TaxID=70996 RepID=A0A0P6YET3_9CHLR|nr:ABC transporter substrate-binding protein [Herpetosiphon geysericola]KPL80633.1 hypothetical protein SE18_23765 [Herpetosiphon geysericola]
MDRQQRGWSIMGRRWSIVSLLLVVVAGCGGLHATPTTVPLDTVTMQLNWVNDFSSAGFFAAEKNGHFADQQIQATLREGGFDANGYIDGTERVSSGDADFGVASADRILQARAEGKPVVGIAALTQNSPLAVLSLPNTNIRTPQDLIGKRVLVSEGGATQLYTALLASQQIDLAQAPPIARTDAGIDQLIAGEIDALVAWNVNEAIALSELGYPPSIMRFSDYGINSYELVVITTEQMVTEKPELVSRFLKAIMQGWQDVIRTPSQAVDYVKDYAPTVDRHGQMQRLSVFIELVQPGSTPLGTMTAERWAFTQQLLQTQGILKTPIDLDRAYSTRFLDGLSDR